MRLGIVDLPEIAIIGDGELHKRVLSGRNRSISEYGGTGGLDKMGLACQKVLCSGGFTG